MNPRLKVNPAQFAAPGQAFPQRFFNESAGLEIVPATDNGPIRVKGYAIVFNAVSKDRGGYRVRFMPGSFNPTPVVRGLWDHQGRDILGRNDNNTLRYTVDQKGVSVEIDLPKTTAGRDVAELVGRRDIRGMSFQLAKWPPQAFETTENIDGKPTRVLNVTRCEIDEFTVTGNPAFDQTTLDIHRPEPASPETAARLANVERADIARFDSIRFGFKI